VRYLDSRDGELDLRDGILEWAEREGFRPLWEMQKEFGGVMSPELDLAFRAFVNPYSRAVLGMLVMSQATESEILTIFQSQFDYQLTPETLALYKKIFWDVAGVGRKQWESLVTQFESEEERSYITFGLSSPSANEVRDILGMDCTAFDHKTILNQIIAKSYLQWKKAIEGPNPDSSMPWAMLTMKAIAQSRSNGIGTANDGEPKTIAERFKGLFSIQPTKKSHTTLADLVGEVGRKQPVKAESK